MPRQFIFTMTAGRTGTEYLSKLLRANIPGAEVHHEHVGYMAYGIDAPELSQVLQFNAYGNTPHVQAFWNNKLGRVLASPSQVYAETSHLLMKAGLIENLPLLLAHGEVHLIVLGRDRRQTIRSLARLHPVLDIAGLWMWFLDPKYPNNLVPSAELMRTPRWGYWYWYLCEVFARAELYRLALADVASVRVTEVTLEEIVQPAGATRLLAALGHAPAGAPVIPPPANQGVNVAGLTDDDLAQLDAWLATQAFDPKAYARAVFAKRGSPAYQPGRP